MISQQEIRDTIYHQLQNSRRLFPLIGLLIMGVSYGLMTLILVSMPFLGVVGIIRGLGQSEGFQLFSGLGLLVLWSYFLRQMTLVALMSLPMVYKSIFIILLPRQRLLKRVQNSPHVTIAYLTHQSTEYPHRISYKFWDQEQRLIEHRFLSQSPRDLKSDSKFKVRFYSTQFLTLSVPLGFDIVP